jgi:putative hemolysin
MDGIWSRLALVLVLVLVNAAFAGSEVALISLREGQLQRLDAQGGRGRLVARLARDPNRFLSTIQVGITLAGFLASAAAAITLAEPLVPVLGFSDAAAELAAVVLVTAVLSYITLVVGELAPKRIALQRPERWARLAARPLTLVTALARPLVWLLSRSTDLLVRLAGADPSVQRDGVTEEEVRDLVAAQASFSPQQRTILIGAFELAERRLRDVLVPRRNVVALPADLAAAEGVRRLVATTHGRAPVFRGDLDDVVGIAHLPDLVDAGGRVADHVRTVLALPESLGVLDALRRLQAERQTLAIVLNEYGGTEGIVTVEDLLEELVGEIYDEFDQDSSGVRREPDGSVVLPGAFPMHDLADLGISLPEGPYATVAGLALQRFGRVPAVGETVEVAGWRLEVLAVERRAITRLRLSPLQAAAPASGEGAPPG